MNQISLLKAMYLTHKAEKMTTPKRMDLQQRRLQDLVSYVKENSPYYAELYKEVGETFLLTDLPITNKVALMDHFDSWMTDRSITRKKWIALWKIFPMLVKRWMENIWYIQLPAPREILVLCSMMKLRYLISFYSLLL